MRWKGFITLSVLLVLSIGGTYLFAPRIIHISVEKTGTAVWGAKVELEGVEISYSPLALRLKGLTVASRTKEFENMMEVESMNFSLLVAPLLERKINIEEVSGRGLAFGSERETSGFIPRRREEEKEDRAQVWRQQLSEWLSQVKKRAEERIDIPEINIEQLSSFEKVRQTRQKLEDVKGQADSIKEMDAQPLASRLENDLEEVKKITIKSEKDVADAHDKINNLKATIKDSEKFINDLNSAASDFQSGVSSIVADAGEIDEARRRDFRRVMDMMQLPSIEVSDIAETVFGPIVVDKFMTFMGYLETARKYIPPRKEKKKASKPPRFKGEDITFYREQMYSPFLIELALVSGAGGEYIKCEDLSSAPWIHGRPAVGAAAASNFEINATFDRTQDIPRDLVVFEYRDFAVDQAVGSLNLRAEFTGNEIDSRIVWAGRGLLPRDWLDYIRLDDPVIEIQARIRGRKSNPAFSISSNLDRILSERLKAELDRQIQEAQRQVQKVIDDEIIPRRDSVMQEAVSLRRETEDTIQEERHTVLDKKREAEREIENKRKEMEAFLAETAKDSEERLRDLFRR